MGPGQEKHADNIDIYIVDCKVSPLSLLPLHHLFMLFVSDISLANGKKTPKKHFCAKGFSICIYWERAAEH